METALPFDAVGVFRQFAALLGDSVVEIGDGLEVLVGDGFIDVDPERFSRLKFRRVGRKMDETQAVRDAQSGPAVPAGIVEHEDDDVVLACTDLFCKQTQQGFEEKLGDAVGQIPEGRAGGGRDESGDIEPFEAVMADGSRPLTTGCPDASDDRLEADAVLIGGKGLDHGSRMVARLFLDDIGKFFLKASASSGVAAFGFFGRGF